jgi:DNA-binding NtrC family response regulator
MMIERFLQADDHRVRVAASGKQAIEKFREERSDLVITDRAMPDISGDEVARAVKDMSPDTPVILLTGFGEIMKDAGEMPEGVDSVMSKPLTLQDLRNVMGRVTGQ